MSQEDCVWVHGRMADHPQLVDCASARVTIDGITHRALNENSTGWRTLCGLHKLWIRDGQFTLAGIPGRRFDFSSASVDCLCCIPAGG